MCRCHTADEIGEQVGLSKMQANDEVCKVLEDLRKSYKVTFSEEGWSPTVYNVRAATRPESLSAAWKSHRSKSWRESGGSEKSDVSANSEYRLFAVLSVTPSDVAICTSLKQSSHRSHARSCAAPSPSVRRRLTFYASCVNTTRAANSRWKAAPRDSLGRVGCRIAPRRVVAGERLPGSVLVPEDAASPHN